MTQSYGPDNYTAHACYDVLPPPTAANQTLLTYGTYQSVNASTPATLTITPNATALSFPYTSSPSKTQAGALLAFAPAPSGTTSVLVRFGVSMRGAAQACANADAEVPAWDFDAVRGAAAGAWRGVLGSVAADDGAEDAAVLELLYSSVRRRGAGCEGKAHADAGRRWGG